jgi:hypothetical protein
MFRSLIAAALLTATAGAGWSDTVTLTFDAGAGQHVNRVGGIGTWQENGFSVGYVSHFLQEMVDGESIRTRPSTMPRRFGRTFAATTASTTCPST